MKEFFEKIKENISYQNFIFEKIKLVPKKFWQVLVVSIFLVFLAYAFFFSAPARFPANDVILIPKGASVQSASQILKTGHIIRSDTLFSVIVQLYSRNGVVAGGYLFDKRENVIKVAQRLAKGEHRLATVKLTFPEGTTIENSAKLCKESLPYCSEEEFIKLATGKEGYIFPDTYFFLQSATAEDVVNTATETFNKKISPLEKEIRVFGKNLADVVTMASLIEEEGKTFEDRQMIASILWKRLQIGMPLQVDASLTYAVGKSTYNLTKADLATTSPYNTYLYKGLPPTPISSPGIESIKATLSPKPTKMLYYLTDRSGNFYYAETYEKHLANRRKYLNSI